LGSRELASNLKGGNKRGGRTVVFWGENTSALPDEGLLFPGSHTLIQVRLERGDRKKVGFSGKRGRRSHWGRNIGETSTETFPFSGGEGEKL